MIVKKIMVGALLMTQSLACFGMSLHTAARCGLLDDIRSLFAKGADINEVDRVDATPLHQAVNNGWTGATLLLLEHGARVDIENQYGETAFYRAVYRRNMTLIKRFLECGADVNGSSFVMPLYDAARYGDVEMVQLLLAYGAHVNARCRGVRSALWIAMENRHKNVVDILLEHGAR